MRLITPAEESIQDLIRAKNKELIADLTKKFNSHEGPRVGDWVRMPDYSMEQFSHDWGDEIQTTDGRFGRSFFMCNNGKGSFSGGLNSAILKEYLTLTEEAKETTFWMFSEGRSGAHRGVNFNILCRVYKYEPL